MVGSIYVVASVFIKTFAQGMKGLKKKKCIWLWYKDLCLHTRYSHSGGKWVKK